MKLLYKEIAISMERMMSKTTKRVPAWEVPMIESMHIVENATDVVFNREEPLSVTEEYDRLRAAYGAEREEDGSIGSPLVERVYGVGAVGIAALKRAMQASVLPKDSAVTPDVASPRIRADLLKALQESDVSDLIGEEPVEEEAESDLI